MSRILDDKPSLRELVEINDLATPFRASREDIEYRLKRFRALNARFKPSRMRHWQRYLGGVAKRLAAAQRKLELQDGRKDGSSPENPLPTPPAEEA